MRVAMLLLLLWTNPAAASRDEVVAVAGLGTSVTTVPGWMLRVEQRVTAVEDVLVRGGRLGLEVWRAGEHTGFNMPIGYHVGGKIDGARATLGGGVGLWALDFHDGETSTGFAPFLASTIELRLDTLVISLDARLSRQLVEDTADFNVYSVMVMVGKRFTR